MKRTPLQRRTPLRARSAKRRAADVELARSREIVQRRAGGLCEARWCWLDDCGYWGTEVHHVLPRAQGGGHEPSNLLLLCSAHHRFAHQAGRRAYELGLLKKRGDQ